VFDLTPSLSHNLSTPRYDLLAASSSFALPFSSTTAPPCHSLTAADTSAPAVFLSASICRSARRFGYSRY
jgi:hypothetical protein